MINRKALRHLAHEIVPPFVMRAMRCFGPVFFSGNFHTWDEALKASAGYDAPAILDKVKASLLKVKSGAAIYERDSVLFDEVEYSWPLLTALLWIASNKEGSLNLVDFGGSLGSSYYQNRKFISHLSSVQWHIVEQPSFVRCGRQYFEDDVLRFHDSLESCLEQSSSDTIILSSVLQYISEPLKLIKKVIDNNFEYVLIDRTPFIAKGPDRITVQHTSSEIYKASYPAWFFNERSFLANFEELYDMTAAFDAPIDMANIPSSYKGYIFRRKT